MSSLENDNEFIEFVSYIVTWARPLLNRVLRPSPLENLTGPEELYIERNGKDN